MPGGLPGGGGMGGFGIDRYITSTFDDSGYNINIYPTIVYNNYAYIMFCKDS